MGSAGGSSSAPPPLPALALHTQLRPSLNSTSSTGMSRAGPVPVIT